MIKGNPKIKQRGLPKGISWIPVKKALFQIKKRLSRKVREINLATSQSENFILSQKVKALRDSPPLTNSAVDGYAFKFPNKDIDRKLEILPYSVYPGELFKFKVQKGKAIKVLTGAVIPAETDTVILQEDIPKASDQFKIPESLRKGANTRRSGEDKKKAEVLFNMGYKLRSQDLALLASAGVPHVSVFERLRVGVLSTGDELVDITAKAQNFQIYDSNRPMLISQLRKWGHEVCDLGIVRDEGESLRSIIVTNRLNLDLIVTTGGASAGDKDYVSSLLNSEGDMVVWRVAIKPGRPFAMGFIDNLPIYALPGNPVAAFVCCLIFLKPSLDFLSGGQFLPARDFILRANFAKFKKRGRTEFLRAKVNKQGSVDVFPSEGSGRVSGLAWSTGLVQLDDNVTEVQIGSPVKFLPYELF